MGPGTYFLHTSMVVTQKINYHLEVCHTPISSDQCYNIHHKDVGIYPRSSFIFCPKLYSCSSIAYLFKKQLLYCVKERHNLHYPISSIYKTVNLCG